VGSANAAQDSGPQPALGEKAGTIYEVIEKMAIKKNTKKKRKRKKKKKKSHRKGKKKKAVKVSIKDGPTVAAWKTGEDCKKMVLG